MSEEHYRCPRCDKHFGSEETFREHARIEHPEAEISQEKEESIDIELKSILARIKSYLNLSFAAGLILGLVISGAAFSGYTYWNSLDHRMEVPVTVVTCDNCSYESFRSSTDRMFNADYREVDYQSDEGQQLINKYELGYVPAFIFDKKVSEAEQFYKVKPVLFEYDDAYLVPDRGNLVAQRVSEGKTIEN